MSFLVKKKLICFGGTAQLHIISGGIFFLKEGGGDLNNDKPITSRLLETKNAISIPVIRILSQGEK